MRAQDFKLNEVLAFRHEQGKLMLGGERMLLFRQQAFAALRRVLFDMLGDDKAGALLFEFGFRCGFGDYSVLQNLRDWDTDDDRLLIGPLMHAWEGIVLVEPHEPTFTPDRKHFHFSGIWRNSYEAQAHKDAKGGSDSPVCLSLTGYGSGWCTAFCGRPVLEVETKCVACGDDHCEWEIRPLDEWGSDARAVPWKEALQEIYLSVQTEERHRRTFLQRRNANPSEGIGDTFGDIVLGGPGLSAVLSDINKVARFIDIPVLILGETGTGKELVARELHRVSGRAGPFVPVNCAAIARDLFPSEMFGHKKHAFTHALEDKIGNFEAARNGTLFLDEVGDLPLDKQSAVLRVLETRKVVRVGDTQERNVDVRILCATNRDLDEAVAQKQFREDLLYRINTYTINIPPLRQRPDDIAALANHFARDFGARHTRGQIVRGVSEDSIERLKQHSWPGNVRELRNVIQRAVIQHLHELQGEYVEVNSLASCKHVTGSYGAVASLDDVQRDHIIELLERVDGVKARVAGLLGIPATTLGSMMKRLGIPLKPPWR